MADIHKLTVGSLTEEQLKVLNDRFPNSDLTDLEKIKTLLRVIPDLVDYDIINKMINVLVDKEKKELRFVSALYSNQVSDFLREKHLSKINELGDEFGFTVGNMVKYSELSFKAITLSHNDIKLSRFVSSTHSNENFINRLLSHRAELIKHTFKVKKEEKTIDVSKQVCLENLLTDKKLLNSCKITFDNHNYWNAVRDAMIHLEVRIREKTQLPLESTGVKLITDAFNATSGKLIVLSALTKEEREGFFHILIGLMKYHRNQKAHHEGILERKDALRIIGYVDYTLDVIETSTRPRDHTDE